MSSPSPPPSPPSEQKLLGRIQRGDQSALAELLRDQQGRLYNLCLRIVGNRDDAAEITQEALLKVVAHIEGFRGEAGLRTWITRILMNQAMTHLRRQRHRRAASLDQSHDGQAGHEDQATALRHQLADGRELRPEQRVEQQEDHRRLHEALGRLEESFRTVLVLRDLEQMSYEQIAEVLDLRVGTVKSRLFRARLALRHALQAADGQAAPNRPGVNES